MPIYEYQCAKCGAITEHLQHVDDPSPKACPQCGARGKSLARLVSSTSFVLKGGGWYRDLYASARPGASSGSGESSPGKGESSPGKGESSPGKGESSPGKGESSPSKGESSPSKGESSPSNGESSPGKKEDKPEKKPKAKKEKS